jgi:hypothetical protein
MISGLMPAMGIKYHPLIYSLTGGGLRFSLILNYMNPASRILPASSDINHLQVKINFSNPSPAALINFSWSGSGALQSQYPV